MAIPKDTEFLVELAERFVNSSAYSSALDLYNQIIATESANPFLYKRRGFIHRMMGELDQAIDDFSHAITLDPDDSASFWERGACRSQKLSFTTDITDNERATTHTLILQDYKASVTRNPSSTEAWLAIIEIHLLMRNWDDAISDYGACMAYITSNEYQLIRAWLGCLALTLAGDGIEQDDEAPLNDDSIRLSRTHWCLSEIDNLLNTLNKDTFDLQKLSIAKNIHHQFLEHFNEKPISFLI